ncbi:hypothetical protein F5Y01DRAFT_285272, partial [Xylaria sp. FL0043]
MMMVSLIMIRLMVMMVPGRDGTACFQARRVRCLAMDSLVWYLGREKYLDLDQATSTTGRGGGISGTGGTVLCQHHNEGGDDDD